MWVKLLVYSIIIVIFYKFLITEKTDITCPQGPNTKDKSVCREGNGKTYNGSQPSSNDKAAILLQKIDIAATAIRKDVVWRKSYIIACISAVFIFGLILKISPTISEVVLTIFIIGTIIYATHNLYNYHHTKHIEDNILASTNLLRSKLANKK